MVPTKSQSQEEVPPAAPRIGRDEMNLAEFPIALLADRVPKGQKTLYFEDKHGQLTVTGSDAYGLPTAIDSDVIVALVYLTKLRNDFRDVKVNFSRYELINLLNWTDESWYYKRIEQSFKRWVGVSLYYDKCWWNNRLKRYTDAQMHIIESVEIIDNDAGRKSHLSGQGGLPLSYFVWNRKFIESCQADNLRQLDLDTYFSLNSAVSKRLYRFLGKRFYMQGDHTFDLHEIAFDRVGLSRNYDGNAGKIKEKLHPAIEELEAIGFLRPLSRDDRYSRIDRGKWTIRLTRQSPTLVAPQQSIPLAAEPEPSPLVAALVARGMTSATAEELARAYPERIERQVEHFDWRMEQKPGKIAEPGAYLADAVKKDYAAPKGFISREERQKQEEARQARARQEADERRRQQEEEARERAERKAVAAYWDALSPPEQADLQARADAEAAPESLADEIPALKRMGQQIRREAYIRQLLKHREAAPADA